MRERADAVSTAVNEVVEKCRYAIKEMYPEAGAAATAVAEVPTGVEGEMLRPTGGDATLWDSMQEVGKKRDPPVVKAFARLSLLG
jgi:elongator complex protein 1